MAASLIFIPALIPMIRKRVRVPATSALATTGALCVIAGTQITLELYLASFMAFTTAVLRFWIYALGRNR